MSTDVTTLEKPAANGAMTKANPIDKDLLSVDQSCNASLLDTRKFWQMEKASRLIAGSDLIPDHFRGKPNNCFIALQLANRLEMDVFMLMQKLYVVHGKPGMEAQLLIAMANARGPFKGRIGYRLEGEGMSRKCTAYATLADTGEIVEATVDMGMAKRMGWLDKKDSMWQKMPDQMLRYRSATFLVRTICPEVSMGLMTRDELEDIEVVPSDNADIMGQLDALTVESKPAETPTETTADTDAEAALKSVQQRNDYMQTIAGVNTAAGCDNLRNDAERDPVLQADDREEVVLACNARAVELGRELRRTKATGEMFEVDGAE